jgi:hypothetical protein
LRGHAVVLHLFGIGRHSVENAQTVGFVGDRDVGISFWKRSRVALNMSTHFCASPLPFAFVGS